MNKRIKLTRAIALALGVTVASGAMATNGYFTHGTGTKNKGMAGAGIALGQDAIDAVNNPALAVLVGDSMQIGAAIFNPNRDYSSTPSQANGNGGAFTIGPNDIEAEKKYRFQPYFATSAMLQENSAIAVAMYSRSGMNTAYLGGTATFDPDRDGPQPVQTFPGTLGDGDTKWSTTEVLLDMSYARQLSEKVSIGFTGVLATRSFKAKGLGSLAPLTETFASSGGSVFPDSLTDNRNDWAYGAGIKVGLHSQLSNSFSFGLMALQ